MFGLLRLLLSLVVATSHTGWRPFGMLDGEAAVIVFFAVSGHAMSGLESRLRFAGRLAPSAAFLRDRALRLWPQYLLWLALAALAAALGVWPPWTAPGTRLTLHLVAMDASILPMTFQLLFPWSDFRGLVPQGWSIGTECCFYLTVPFLCADRRIAFGLAVASLGVFTAACLRLVPTGPYVYVLPFGTLAFFILGHAVFRRDRALAILILGILTGNFALLALDARLDLLMQAILLGAGAAVPALLLARHATWMPPVLDRRLGDASYGVYLCHILLISVLGLDSWLVRSVAPVVLLSTLAGMFGSAAIDRPVARWRRRIRDRFSGPRPAAVQKSVAPT